MSATKATGISGELRIFKEPAPSGVEQKGSHLRLEMNDFMRLDAQMQTTAILNLRMANIRKLLLHDYSSPFDKKRRPGDLRSVRPNLRA
jgi:hypothetical protein